jgi:two-component system, OmpR family, KDP operon response regulator KdpE
MSETSALPLPPEILVVEDDAEIRRFLRTTLSAEHYRLREATTAAGGIAQATTREPDAILLDLGLPDADGIEVIRQVRQRNRNLPIIILSVRSHERDKIVALDAGADDFINKPFAVGELLARLRAALRRTATRSDATPLSIFRTGDIEVNLNKRRVVIGGVEVRLTRTEYKLLQILIRHADQVVTHSQLLNEVWGPNHAEQIHYLRVYMLQLRRKLEADPARPRYLRTEPGIGYRLTTEHFPQSWRDEGTPKNTRGT